MRIDRIFCVLLLFISTLHAQEIRVQKEVLATPGPNLFYERPSLALNERNKQVQVVWERSPGNHPDHATLARKISPKGVLKGSVRTLIEGSNTYTPVLVYNRNKNEFALVYADELPGPPHAVHIRALTAKGQLRGNPIMVSTDTGSAFANQHTIATFDPVHNIYVVVWTRSSTTPDAVVDGEGLTIAVLDEDFVTVAGPALLRGQKTNIPVTAAPLDVTVLPSGRIWVAFSEHTDASMQRIHYYVASLPLDLSSKITKRVRKSVATTFGEATFADLSSGTFLYFKDKDQVRKRRIDPLGRPVGATARAFNVTPGSRPLTSPAFASIPQSDGSTKGLLVAIEDFRQESGNGGIWIQQINGSGNPIGPAELIDSGFITASALQVVTLPSTTANQGRFSIVYVNGVQLNLPPQGEFSELIHLNLTVPLE